MIEQKAEELARELSLGLIGVQKGKQVILALIASEQDALYREAFNKGNQIGMATQALEDKKILQPMVEALKESKEFVEAYIERYTPKYSNPSNLVAKINAALKGEGK